VKDNHL